MKIVPGEVSPTNCITTLGLAPLSVKAGTTKFFTVTTYDLFNNLEVQSYDDTHVDILARYVEHTTLYSSPISVPDLPNWSFIYGKDISGIALDRFDGTYASQFTIYRAGTYALSIKVNEVDVKQSPYQMAESDYLYVTPSDLYAPNCIVKQVVLAYTAGTLSGFDVQGRDFYSNNLVVKMSSSITDSKVEFRDPITKAAILQGALTDSVAGNGVFHVAFTPTIAGSYLMYIQLNGLDVDSSPYTVTVAPAALTNAPHSTIVNINSMEFATGETLRFIIESRDIYSNLRTASKTDAYQVTLVGQTSGTIWTAAVPSALLNGTYAASFKFTIAEEYTLHV